MAERSKILSTADHLISKDRADVYGPPRQSFGRIGALWGAMLGTDPIAPEMVALMLVQLKVSRIISSPDHEDSWVDLAGYGALGGELATDAPRSEPGAGWTLKAALSEAVEAYLTEHPGWWTPSMARKVVQFAGETSSIAELEARILNHWGTAGMLPTGTPRAVLNVARKLVAEQLDAAVRTLRG